MRKGSKQSEEAKRKMSEARMGKSPWNKGIHIYLGGKKFEKGSIPWNKDLKGIHLSPESEWKKGQIPEGSILFKKGENKKEENKQWKGDMVTYSGLHRWIYAQLGQPSECEHCGRTDAKKYEWANKSGLYTRELTDWIRLCTRCHREYDGHAQKMWQTRRLQNGI